MPVVSGGNLKQAVRANIKTGATVYTDAYNQTSPFAFPCLSSGLLI
jgi:hypothetical protein